MQQVLEQHGNYAHRILPGNKWTVDVKRFNQGEIFYEECHNEDTMFCGTCSRSSPIPRFIRIREVSFFFVTDELASVECTCIHNDGCTCRHIASLINVDFNHFLNRYQRKYIVHVNTKRDDPMHQHCSMRHWIGNFSCQSASAEPSSTKWKWKSHRRTTPGKVSTSGTLRKHRPFSERKLE
jgi:hypothetical protein